MTDDIGDISMVSPLHLLAAAALFIPPAAPNDSAESSRRMNALPHSHSAFSIVDSMAITVRGVPRGFSFTDKDSGWFYGETNSEARNAWHGWFINARKVLSDYRLHVDGSPLKRDSSTVVRVFPHMLERRYSNGIIEEFFLPDRCDEFLLRIVFPDEAPHEVAIQPLFDSQIPDLRSRIHFADGILFVDRASQIGMNESSSSGPGARGSSPGWIALSTSGIARFAPNDSGPSMPPGNPYQALPPLVGKGTGHIEIAVAAGWTKEESASRVREGVVSFHSLLDAKRSRLDDLFARSDASFPYRPELERALRWARVSIDALIMNQRGIGIFAGLPWFDNYWGRDTFISLPGATLVTGDFSTARAVLRDYARFQERDSASSNYGRIPNQVTPLSISYNTADGTPWFVISLAEYVRRSGDTALARDLYAVVVRAMEGTLRHHSDPSGFLTHGNAETWMDAVGPDGPWSPRGNRAVDIQWLWYEQMSSSAAIARLLGDSAHDAAWTELAGKLRSNFLRHFVDTKAGGLYDHLKPDGTPSRDLRPNQMFALPLLREDIAAGVTRTVVGKLTYPYGVASLWQGDPNFHPYHHEEQAYVPDAAYHNGTVWLWLAGTVIDGLVTFGREDLAAQLIEWMVHDICDRGAVGTLSELLDALPRPGRSETALSGTFSQAWSLAEFIRVMYEDFFGVHPDLLHRRIDFAPHLTEAMEDVTFTMPVAGGTITFTKHGNSWFITSGARERLDVHFSLRSAAWGQLQLDGIAPLPAGGKLVLEIQRNGVSVNGKLIRSLQKRRIAADLSNLTFAVPASSRDFPSLRGPSYPILSLDDVKKVDPSARVLWDASDPARDDTGSSGYRYPLNPVFQPGILDVTHCRIASDSSNLYVELQFRDLVNPGWHPEYGFQLTYVALAVDRGDQDGSRRVGMNAQYEFPLGFKFQRILYVGGGIRIDDAAGNAIAEYRPKAGDVRDPIGNAVEKSLTFSVPLKYIGESPTRWKFAVLVGAQDDHGGAGLGEFRTVSDTPTEWTGGGKKSPSLPNVYDVLTE